MEVTSLLFLVACVGSMLISGELARELGRANRVGSGSGL
jgi:hypothetical protein